MKASPIDLTEEIKTILGNTLQLGARAAALSPDSALLGNIPELDSMALLSVITQLEEHFGIVVDDEDMTADTFATLGSLTGLVSRKLG